MEGERVELIIMGIIAVVIGYLCTYIMILFLQYLYSFNY